MAYTQLKTRYEELKKQLDGRKSHASGSAENNASAETLPSGNSFSRMSETFNKLEKD
jgi:hypothetical protein